MGRCIRDGSFFLLHSVDGIIIVNIVEDLKHSGFLLSMTFAPVMRMMFMYQDQTPLEQINFS